MQQKLPPEFRKRFSFCLTFGYDVCEKKMHESQLIPIPYFTDVFNVDAGIGNQKLNKSFYIEDYHMNKGSIWLTVYYSYTRKSTL